ncbi:hypothetical protein FH972_023377 [Carpinus fangiana]|uniref:HbrB-like protein n=1 Tax=Carpinus fangiana TaxID=176857 RepID=A0A5N6KVH5_9ROSI|nr:hypothetical protein FH972_023377 [Carpinus fangiana]
MYGNNTPPKGQLGRSHQRTSSYPQRPSSISSESSASSQVTTVSSTRPSPYIHQNAQASASTTSIPSSGRGPHLRPPRSELPLRQSSPLAMAPIQSDRTRPRHPQGFFEPSLPTTSHNNLSQLDTSRIAARAAVQHQNDRNRSQTIPDPTPLNRRKPSGPSPINTGQSSAGSSRTNSLVDDKLAATTAANAAYPRSPNFSPVLQQGERVNSPAFKDEPKQSKEKSRMKLFHKPKAIHTSRTADRPVLPSPKGAIYAAAASTRANQSTTSLADSLMSSASSLYSSANASTSTLVPLDKSHTGEKEKTRHHFLSRQKHKEHHLPLSSASSNSRPTDPAAPQPLYSFTPSSPGIASKSISGLDLRHGGRALREKKKEEKAAAHSFVPPVGSASSLTDAAHPGHGFDWTGSSANLPGASSGANMEIGLSAQSLGGFGLQGMGIDDAWPLLKARLLNIFEGEDLRTPIEDFNRLVTAHLQRCIARRAPQTIVDDLRELLHTGFSSLDMTLRGVPDERLVLHLVDMWAFVFGTILPFMQAVFLPLDLEFRGRGPLLSPRDASEFWAAVVSKPLNTPTTPTVAPSFSFNSSSPLEIRTLVLSTFRDVIILPRHEGLLTTFSRLSLDSINAPPLPPLSPLPPPSSYRPGTAGSSSAGLDPAAASFNSQGSTLLETASSLGARSRATSNTSAGSFHSLNSTRPRHGTIGSAGASSLPSLSSSRGVHAVHDAGLPLDSAKVTQTAARMLQCISVLAGLKTARLSDSRDGSVAGSVPLAPASVSSASTSSGSFEQQRKRAATLESEDRELVARRKMERLAKELKLNWLGRGRTGRNRRGFVGSKVRPGGLGIKIGA